jgi:sigma-B regulation protein RsbU (phosphoserine phosphatase)
VHRLIPICLAAVLAAVLLASCAPQREVPPFEGWTYTRDGAASRFTHRLPAAPRTHLVLRGYVDEFTVSVDRKRVYAYRDSAANGRLTLHVIALPPDSAGATIELFVPRTPDSAIFGAAPLLATNATLPVALAQITVHPWRDDLADIVLGFLFTVIGIVSLLAAALRRRGDVTTMAAMGAFTSLYGARLVLDSYVPIFFGASLRTIAQWDAIITYVIPIAGWYVPLRLIGDGWKRSLRWQVLAFAVFAPIAIASDFITGRPESLEPVNNVLVIAGGINILGNLLYLRQRRTPELRVVLAGSVVFMLFALVNNLSALGLLPWRRDVESIGFVIFVGSLGYAATRAFVRGERERIAIDHELDTAREIQRSILPASMPDVRGLRVRAGYDPASSVAGDVYDFLRVDESHTGVLVADVAGHGVPAALIASMVKVAVSSQTHLRHDPASMLRDLNITLRREVHRAFVTATYLWFDMDARTVTVCNAGHIPPLLFRDGAFSDLGPQGVLLGRFASAHYSASSHELRRADRVVAFTDGILEARNGRDEQFGEERLRAIIAAGADADAVLHAVNKWRGTSRDDVDDLTIVVIDVT